ncbi:MAG: quinol:electron acceptor oxidoreductase subunit ActD [Gammaproteobacteria bacterium]
MRKGRILALFSNFDEAFAAISDIRHYKIPGVSVDDVTVISPIEHPEIEEILGERPAHVPKFTLTGALFGLTFGFLFLASAQANFTVQPQGGKAVIPLPSNIVLTYEMLILFGVLFTLTGCLIGARLLRKRKSLYSEKVSLDQVGIELEVDEKYIEPLKELFTQHQALEIREEVIK